jgi:hypothetical protein
MTMRHSAFPTGRLKAVGALCLICAIATVSPGCSRPTTAHVYGTVFAPDGKPLPGGTVVFYPTEGAKTLPARANLNQDGTYDMPKAPVGQVKISVSNIHIKEGIPPPVGIGGGAPPGVKMPAGAPPMMKGPPKGVNMGPPKTVDTSKAPGGGSAAAPAAPDRYVPIPDKYANQDTSGLTLEVKPGKQQHDIKLTK